MKKLKNNMTTKSDGISFFFIKDCIAVLSTTLKLIYHLKVRSRTFPTGCKEVKVSLVCRAIGLK